MPIDQRNPARCGLSWATKVVASGVFITGREPDNILKLSCGWMAAPDSLLKEAIETKNPAPILSLPIEADVNADEKSVRLSLNGEEGFARFIGDQGCVILDRPDDDLHFTPRPVERKPIKDGLFPDDAAVTGEEGATGLDAEKLRAAVDGMFDNPMQFTNAFVVLHEGRPIVERYRAPFGPSTQFESWSMGKSIAATLIGVCEREGRVDLDEDGLFDAWRGADDKRRAIRARDLLNMASGLQFSGSYGKDEDHSVKSENGVFLDHIYVYGGGVNSFEFSRDKPLADPPGAAGRYRNCDPLLAVGLARERAVGGDIEAFLNWPQQRLYDRIGSDGMVLETDPYGHFLISGHDYGRARDWARLGQLYLQRGAWGGDQILNEDFVDFVQTPAEKAWAHNPYYGGFFCTNATGLMPGSPKDVFWMSGGGLQRTMIIPSKDLVIVRLGHMSGAIFGVEDTLNETVAAIAALVA